MGELAVIYKTLALQKQMLTQF